MTKSLRIVHKEGRYWGGNGQFNFDETWEFEDDAMPRVFDVVFTLIDLLGGECTKHEEEDMQIYRDGRLVWGDDFDDDEGLHDGVE